MTKAKFVIIGWAMLTIIMFIPHTYAKDDLSKQRERANSDDAQSTEEVYFHADARALVIRNIEPNKLRVGGRELRVKRNLVGIGCLVYDPRTEFHGMKRNLVWWVPKDGNAYPLNSPSKMVTPGLQWPREERADSPSTSAVVAYVFGGKPMTASAPSRRPALPKGDVYTVKEYRIYRAVMDTPMSVSEAQAYQSTGNRYSVTVAKARKATEKVQKILSRNGWFGSPGSEIQHVSDWKGEKP